MRKRFILLGISLFLTNCSVNNIPVIKPTPLPNITSSPTPVSSTTPTPKPEFDINSVKYSSLIVEGNYDESIISQDPSSYRYFSFSGDGNLIADTRSTDYKEPFVIDLRNVYTYKTVNLSAKVMLNDNTNYTNISWESSDKNVFEVSQDGKITPINTGKANVIVKEKTSGKTLISSEIDITGQKYIPTPQPYPTGSTGEYFDFEILSGTVEDTQGNKLDDVQMILKAENGISQYMPGYLQISSNGYYNFRLLPSGIYEITASKKGYKSVTIKTRSIKSNLNQDPNINKYDFTGANALQKE